MKKIINLLILVSIFMQGQNNPAVNKGTIERISNFESKFISSRNIDVWLPDNYNNKKKYAVLYMHDGQMLFDAEITWNKQAWEVEEVVSKLTIEHKIKDIIVVGIWNSGETRHNDYFPQKPFEKLTSHQQDSIYQLERSKGIKLFNGKVNSDNYLKFITKELKPIIDKKFNVYTDKANTFIAGSSMGGLISMYAICEYPEIFGGAACISTHWTGIFNAENNPIPEKFLEYLKEKLPNPKNHKFYFDYGTEGIDAFYEPTQLKVDQIGKEKGYSSKNWFTKKYIGENHSEKAWQKRLHIPLIFLIKN